MRNRWIDLSETKTTSGNPLFKALAAAPFGALTIVTPEGERRQFTGKSDGPQANWLVRDWSVIADAIAQGEIGFAESYMDSRWETDDLTALITYMLVNSDSLEKFFHGRPWYGIWMLLQSWFRRNSLRGSQRNIEKHYDLGNAFYQLWLDDSMTYSCGLFQDDPSRSLEAAQKAKYQRILSKTGAKAGDHLLEIGCGWGGFAEIAAGAGVRVTGVTLSHQQAAYARERMARQGLGSLVSIELKDYRHVVGQFDHIVSIGMFEHVGKQYWPEYFRTIKQRLKPGGTAMVQTITLDDRLFVELGNTTGFIEKYIFPGGMLPSKTRFRAEADAAGLKCNELFAFGLDYARTLSEWSLRFEAHIDQVRALGYDERFIRMWRFYLSCCIASFVSKRTDVMQAELTHAA